MEKCSTENFQWWVSTDGASRIEMMQGPIHVWWGTGVTRINLTVFIYLMHNWLWCLLLGARVRDHTVFRDSYYWKSTTEKNMQWKSKGLWQRRTMSSTNSWAFSQRKLGLLVSISQYHSILLRGLPNGHCTIQFTFFFFFGLGYFWISSRKFYSKYKQEKKWSYFGNWCRTLEIIREINQD